MENHEFGVAPEAFTKWIVLNDTYDILSTSKDRLVTHVPAGKALVWWFAALLDDDHNTAALCYLAVFVVGQIRSVLLPCD